MWSALSIKGVLGTFAVERKGMEETINPVRVTVFGNRFLEACSGVG